MGGGEYKTVPLSINGTNYVANARNTTNFATLINNNKPTGYKFSHLISNGAYSAGALITTYIDSNSPQIIYAIPNTAGNCTVYANAVYVREDL